jgi:hypothetical protein
MAKVKKVTREVFHFSDLSQEEKDRLVDRLYEKIISGFKVHAKKKILRGFEENIKGIELGRGLYFTYTFNIKFDFFSIKNLIDFCRTGDDSKINFYWPEEMDK